MMKKVAVFVDVQNIYYTVKESHGAHFDYSIFWAEVTSGREVVKAIAYAIDRGDPRQIAFQQILRDIGFEATAVSQASRPLAVTLPAGS